MIKKREVVLGISGAIILPALWAASGGVAAAGPPRSANATVTRTGSAGNTVSRQSNVATNGQGGYSAKTTATGPAGNTVTRQSSGAYNAATQTYARSGTTTGPTGNQSSFSTSVQATGNGHDRTATHTGPNGKTVTSSGQATYNPATGTLNQSRTVTGPNGKSATESRAATVTPAPQTPSN